MQPLNMENKASLLLPLVCAVLSAAMFNLGFSFLFLAPLGFAVLRNAGNAPLVFAASAVLNAALAFFLRSRLGVGTSGFALDFSYFAVLALVFIWTLAEREKPPALQVRKLYQLIGAAALGAVVFLLIVFDNDSSSAFATSLRAQADVFSTLWINTAGADVARRSFLEQTVTPQGVLEILRGAMLRGGAVAFMLFIIYINRRMAQTAYWIAKKRRAALAIDLPLFHAPVNAIWCLSFSIGAVLLGRIVGISVLEIAAWNVLVVCAVIFAAQGAGIVMFSIAKWNLPPIMRLFFNIIIFVIIISPGINIVALNTLVFLGIAENWLPIRVLKNDGAPRTPGE